MEAAGIGIGACCGWYWSATVPPCDQAWFVNAVASLATVLAARQLLAVLQAIETRFGRVRGEPNAARVIDLDLLDYHAQRIESGPLILPHPRLHRRRFVLVPLAEIAPDWRHP